MTNEQWCREVLREQRRQRALSRKASKAWRKRRKQQGLCADCADGQAVHGTVRCLRCTLKKHAKHHLGHRARWKELAELFVQQGGRCAYTGVKLKMGVNASVDHVVARSVAPEREHDITNLKWVHVDVNKAKGALSLEEYVKQCERVLRHMKNE